MGRGYFFRCFNSSLLITVGAVALIGLFLVSCSGRGGPEKSTEKSTAEKKQMEVTAPQTLPGKAVLERVCTTCHSLERIEKAKKDRAGWEKTVDRMISFGAQLNEGDKEVLLDYLSSNYK